MPNTPRKPNKDVLDRIDNELEYFPISGKVYWKIKHYKSHSKGKEIGTLNGKGYLSCRINKVPLKIHHIAWYKFYGYWPDKETDHINHVRSDNRILNLRLVSSKENRHNSLANKSNITGQLGITFIDKWRRKKYHLDLYRNGTRISSFHYTLKEAMEVKNEFIKASSESGP